MESLEEYRRRAEEAEALARRATTEAERQAYEKIAEGWRELVTSAELALKRGY